MHVKKNRINHKSVYQEILFMIMISHVHSMLIKTKNKVVLTKKILCIISTNYKQNTIYTPKFKCTTQSARNITSGLR